MTRAARNLARCAGLLLWLWIASVAAAQVRELRLPDGSQATVSVDTAAGDTVVLWLPSGIPGPGSDAELARAMAALGVEVWRADLLGAYFLPTLESSLDQIPDTDIVALIDQARAGGRRVALLASARAGILALRGAAAWRQAHPGDPALAGAILLHPNLYVGPPEPGREAEFHPVVAGTRLPLVVIQPEKSPWHFRLDALRKALEQGGAALDVQKIPAVRDRYYFRPDATPAEGAETARLPARVRDALATLRGLRVAPAVPVAVATTAAARTVRERELQPYRGSPVPPALKLATLDGRTIDLAGLRGQVVLVNFWASWCPPCVREMPSMQRLREKLDGRPFTILAVNMAEAESDIQAFLDKTPVSFPVLLDRDGSALKLWKVFVFPTSFVIGPDGRIRYALYGELEWDSAATLHKLNGLFVSP